MSNTVPMPTARGANIRAEPDMESLASALRSKPQAVALRDDGSARHTFGAPKPGEPPPRLGAEAIELVMNEVALAAEALSGAGEALNGQVHKFVTETKGQAERFITEARQLKTMTDEVSKAIENTLGKHNEMAARVTEQMAIHSALCETVTKAADDLRRAMVEAQPETVARAG